MHSEADDNEICVSIAADDSARVPLRDGETMDPNTLREFKYKSGKMHLDDDQLTADYSITKELKQKKLKSPRRLKTQVKKILNANKLKSAGKQEHSQEASVVANVDTREGKKIKKAILSKTPREKTMKIEEQDDDRVLKTETSPKNQKASSKTPNPKISKFAKSPSPKRKAIPTKGLP